MAGADEPFTESRTCQILDSANNPLAKAFKLRKIDFVGWS
jgi:hypothetical protein